MTLPESIARAVRSLPEEDPPGKVPIQSGVLTNDLAEMSGTGPFLRRERPLLNSLARTDACDVTDRAKLCTTLDL